MRLWFFMDSIAEWPMEVLARAHTPALGGGIGGAESMTIGMAMRLAARGHDVTIWTTKLECDGLYGQAIGWRSVERYLRGALTHEPSPDIFVSVRRAEVFSLPEFQHCTARRVLWAQDRYNPAEDANMKNVEALIYVSEWQRQQWMNLNASLADKWRMVTPVALDAAWIQPWPSPRDVRRHTYIYASRPERGLQPLLAMWPEIRRVIPNAHLIVTGYTQGVDVALADRLIAPVARDIGGIEIARSDDKVGLFRQFARASLLLYPGQVWFEETNGSICSQAMAAGVIPLVSRRGALPETVPDRAGMLFDGDPCNPCDSAYQDAFIAAVAWLSQPDAGAIVALRQEAGRSHVLPACDYSTVTDLWEEMCLTLSPVSPLSA